MSLFRLTLSNPDQNVSSPFLFHFLNAIVIWVSLLLLTVRDIFDFRVNASKGFIWRKKERSIKEQKGKKCLLMVFSSWISPPLDMCLLTYLAYLRLAVVRGLFGEIATFISLCSFQLLLPLILWWEHPATAGNESRYLSRCILFQSTMTHWVLTSTVRVFSL